MNTGDDEIAEHAPRISQRIGFRGVQEIRLSDEQVLFRMKRLGSLVEFAVPYLEIESNGIRIFRRAWITTFLFLPALLIANCYFLYCAIFGFKSYQANWWTALVIGLVFLFIAIVHCLQGWANCVLFRSSKGNIVIMYDRPSVEASRTFVAELERRIEDARNASKLMRSVND